MSSPVPPSPESDRAVLGAAPAIAMWHVGWATVCALLALVGRFAGVGAEGMALWALFVMAAPGMAGLLLLARDDARARRMLLTAWGLAAILAAVLTGGVSGVLGGFVFMPLIAGLALGGAAQARLGALAAGLAAAAGLIPPLVGAATVADPALAAVTGVMAATAAAFALRLGHAAANRRLQEAEQAMARSEAVLRGQPGLTLILTPSGRLLAAYGAPPPGLDIGELFEQGLIAAVHAPDRPAVLSGLDKALSGLEARTRFAPRGALDRRVALALRRLDDGRVIGQLHDAAAQWAREAAMDAARVEAEAKNAGKSRFLAAMSHELRTPLNAVTGFADIMRQRLFGPLPERYADYAESIHQASGHLLSIINDVLDVSRIEADRYELAPERFDARSPLSEAVAMIRLAAEEKGLSLTSVMPPEPLSVMADRRALKQIALNLLSNAVKFTPEGGSVTLTAEAIGPYLEVSVADTGVGVAPEDLKRLGRPFEQAGDPDQKALGSGLGLALVRSLAELHGGRLLADSTLGEGSAFTVRMPVAGETAAEQPAL